MHLCMLDYVGHDKIDPALNVVEICRQINGLKQVQCFNGRLHKNTPDKLFDQFNEISVILPDNASTWTLQLCSSYLSVLTSDLSEAVTSEKTFIMPDLSTLTTKASQLEALQKIRTQASTTYKEQQKEKEK